VASTDIEEVTADLFRAAEPTGLGFGLKEDDIMLTAEL